MDWNISIIQLLLEKGLDSTSNITDGYYLLDKNGSLITFTGIDNDDNTKYRGTDLSSRDYFKIPKENGSNYMSPVLVSNDGIPRMYISVPIFSESVFRLRTLATKQAKVDRLKNQKTLKEQ